MLLDFCMSKPCPKRPGCVQAKELCMIFNAENQRIPITNFVPYRLLSSNHNSDRNDGSVIRVGVIRSMVLYVAQETNQPEKVLNTSDCSLTAASS